MSYPQPHQKPSEEFHAIAFEWAARAESHLDAGAFLPAQTAATLAQAYATMALYREYYRTT